MSTAEAVTVASLGTIAEDREHVATALCIGLYCSNDLRMEIFNSFKKPDSADCFIKDGKIQDDGYELDHRRYKVFMQELYLRHFSPSNEWAMETPDEWEKNVRLMYTDFKKRAL